MTRQRRAQVVTGVVIAIVGIVLIARQKGWYDPSAPVASIVPAVKADPTPQDAIYAALDAAREGDTGKYLGFHTGQMEAGLNQAIAESGPEGFSRYLKESNAAIKGIAITEPQTLTDRDVRVRVEFVFEDRNEVQFFYLEKTGGAWKIARVDAAQRIKTIVPYGTPVQ